MEYINKVLWLIAVSALILASIYYTIKLKFIQFEFKKMFKNIRSNNAKISPFETLMVTLGGKIGVGSIAGIALSIYVGGIGSIFWLWIIAILSSVLAYVETFLGILYQDKNDDVPIGGPSYYITKGLNLKSLGIIYSILIIISYIGGFLGIQSNTIVKSFNSIFYLNPIIIGSIIVIITLFCIIGGIKRISDISSKIVPIMSILYFGLTFYIVFNNIDKVPFIIIDIIKSGLNIKSLHGGFIMMVIIGIQRGIFSSESGLGTASIIASSSDVQASKQGLVQILGVYITSLLICTSTALIVLTSPYDIINYHDLNGIEIIHFAFNYHFGSIGSIILFIFITLFSFSTILTGYYYGEVSLKFLFKKVDFIKMFIFKIVVLILIFLGTVLPSTFLWNVVDSLVAILAIINVYAIMKLRHVVVSMTDCYRL